MVSIRGGWVNLIGAIAGGILILVGVFGLRYGFDIWDSFLAVLGFLILGWAALDYRRFRRGTPESEVGGGHTIE